MKQTREKPKLGDMVRPALRTTNEMDPQTAQSIEDALAFYGVGLVVDIKGEELYGRNLYNGEPPKFWVDGCEYSVLWSGIGKQIDHKGFDIIKITGADI